MCVCVCVCVFICIRETCDNRSISNQLLALIISTCGTLINGRVAEDRSKEVSLSPPTGFMVMSCSSTVYAYSPISSTVQCIS